MKFTKIPSNTFEQLQLNAGILLSAFNPDTAEVQENDMLGATSGGIAFADVPEYTDLGEDIDNAPKNTKELKRITDREITLGGTFLTVSTARAKSLIAAADIDADGKKITPRDELRDEDFTDIWWVGDYSDKNGASKGGFIAVHLKNALSTGGFAIQSGDRAKGQFAFTYSAHYLLADQNQVPYDLYIVAGADETTE